MHADLTRAIGQLAGLYMAGMLDTTYSEALTLYAFYLNSPHNSDKPRGEIERVFRKHGFLANETIREIQVTAGMHRHV